jgi:hypothetical protein|tara:strand:+ start:2091 stop:2279 length:189 start_codon:yes stop_codon:yes gene_type:complete
MYEYCAPRVAYIFVSAKEEKKEEEKAPSSLLAGKMVMKSRAFSRRSLSSTSVTKTKEASSKE